MLLFSVVDLTEEQMAEAIARWNLSPLPEPKYCVSISWLPSATLRQMYEGYCRSEARFEAGVALKNIIETGNPEITWAEYTDQPEFRQRMDAMRRILERKEPESVLDALKVAVWGAMKGTRFSNL